MLFVDGIAFVDTSKDTSWKIGDMGKSITVKILRMSRIRTKCRSNSTNTI
jgi:hypothetical protein